MAGPAQEEIAPGEHETGRVLRYVLIGLLVVAVVVEGYYIYLLHDTIEKRNDELSNISVQLQFLKNEREDLRATLSEMQEREKKIDGHTTER